MKRLLAFFVLALLTPISIDRIMADGGHQPSFVQTTPQLPQIEHIDGVAEESSGLIATVYWTNGLSYLSPVYKVGPYLEVVLSPLSSQTGEVELAEPNKFETIAISSTSNSLLTRYCYFDKYIETQCPNPRDENHRPIDCTLMVVSPQ